MKLIFCKVCQDVIKLALKTTRYCKCGSSAGRYLDNLNAEISGKCIPLGFANSSLAVALANQPERDWGREFNAFVIEKECPTIKVLKRHVAPKKIDETLFKFESWVTKHPPKSTNIKALRDKLVKLRRGKKSK